MSQMKYPRTYHLPWSESITSDDKVINSLSHFLGRMVTVTEKMDGENTSLYRDCIHARSLDSKGGKERAWVKQFWSNICHEIPEGWRICGENLWASHSIHYKNLHSFFYGFSIWDETNKTLSWTDTIEFFNFLKIWPVPVIYSGIWDEKVIRNLNSTIDFENTEGYVVRISDSFTYDKFNESVAKFVRKNHVQTSKHWKNQKFVPNLLV